MITEIGHPEIVCKNCGWKGMFRELEASFVSDYKGGEDLFTAGTDAKLVCPKCNSGNWEMISD